MLRIGKFECKTGKMVVTDPCYPLSKDTSIIDMEPGVYSAFVGIAGIAEKDNTKWLINHLRCTSLTITHIDHEDRILKANSWRAEENRRIDRMLNEADQLLAKSVELLSNSDCKKLKANEYMMKTFKEIERIGNENWWTKSEFSTGVDSGQAGFFDYGFYPKHDDDAELLHMEKFIAEQGLPPQSFENHRWALFYDAVCKITSGSPYGLTDEIGFGGCLEGGVASSTGFGDGHYSVETASNKGKLVAARLLYITEEENEDEE